jgi:hypothetical protein
LLQAKQLHSTLTEVWKRDLYRLDFADIEVFVCLEELKLSTEREQIEVISAEGFSIRFLSARSAWLFLCG